jgi:GNAT superfamily N-acetyltransferase
VDGDLRIRHCGAGAEELDAIVAINRASATAAYAPIFGGAPYPEGGVRRRYERLLEDCDVRVFIADGVGYAAARPGHVEALYVVPEAWGTGVADALYDCVAEIAGSPATLWVLEANERGRRFWERRGWRPTGERDDSKEPELQYAR